MTSEINQSKIHKVLKICPIKVISLKVYFEVDHWSNLYLCVKISVFLNNSACCSIFVQILPFLICLISLGAQPFPISCVILWKTITNFSGDAEDHQPCKLSSYSVVEGIPAQNVCEKLLTTLVKLYFLIEAEISVKDFLVKVQVYGELIHSIYVISIILALY